jgi:hypothetical protein
VTSEAERLTTVAFLDLLTVSIPRGTDEPVELTSGSGYSLYHDPDGWKVKLLVERSISLNRATLRERGWHFETAERPEG